MYSWIPILHLEKNRQPKQNHCWYLFPFILLHRYIDIQIAIWSEKYIQILFIFYRFFLLLSFFYLSPWIFCTSPLHARPVNKQTFWSQINHSTFIKLIINFTLQQQIDMIADITIVLPAKPTIHIMDVAFRTQSNWKLFVSKHSGKLIFLCTNLLRSFTIC